MRKLVTECSETAIHIMILDFISQLNGTDFKSIDNESCSFFIFTILKFF